MLLEVTVVAGVPAAGAGGLGGGVAGTSPLGLAGASFQPTELSISWPAAVKRADCSGLSLQRALAKRWPGCSFSVGNVPLETLFAGTCPLVNGAIVVARAEQAASGADRPCAEVARAGSGRAGAGGGADPGGVLAVEDGTAAVLAVCSGPGAGAVFALHRGTYTMGRGQCRISIADPGLSRHHGTLVVGAHSITLAAARGSSGFTLRSLSGSPTASAVPVKGTAVLEAGQSIACGSSTLELRFREPGSPEAASSAAPSRFAPSHSTPVSGPAAPDSPPGPDISVPAASPRVGEAGRAGGAAGVGGSAGVGAAAGVVAVGEAPAGSVMWPLNPAALEPLVVPNPLGAARNRGPMVVAGCLPLVLGVVLAVLTGSWMFLAFSAMGAMTVLVPLFGGSKRRKGLSAAVHCAAGQDAVRRSRTFPDAGTLAMAAHAGIVHPRSRPVQMTAELRIGTAPQPAAVLLSPDNPAFSAPLLPGLPFCVPLGSMPVTISGPPSAVLGLVRYALMQLDAAGLQVVLLGSADILPLAARFLPRTVLATTVHRAARELAALRLGAAAEAGSLPGALVIVNEPTDPLIFSAPGLSILHFAMLSPELAATAKDAPVRPPGSAGTAAVPHTSPSLSAGAASPHAASPPTGHDLSSRVWIRAAGNRVEGTCDGGTFIPDGVPAEVFDSYARRRAGTDAAPGPSGTASLAANSLPLPEQGTAEALMHQWRLAAGGPLRPIPLGQSGSGPTLFDFRHDGPHLLVGGTTGSGKSEFLRTLVGSLAAFHSPADLQFVFIDFKGGAGLGVLGKLPHTSSLITDLGGHGMDRTLASLRTELHSREAALAAMEASDSDAYRSRARQGGPGAAPGGHAMAHLVVVVDEFRVLVDQFPDALAELMRLAAVGRSLGIHLVMATQRPQGALNADIRANVTSSICLRVQSAFDSTDVIGTGVAATISVATPGRAYISRAASPPEEFQSATLRLPLVVDGGLPLVELAVERLAAGSVPAADTRISASDGGAVADLMAGAWRRAIAAGTMPCAAPAVVAAELPADVVLRQAGTAGGAVLLGLADVPQIQSLEPLPWHPELHSHVACLGTAAETSAAVALMVRQLLAANANDFGPPRSTPRLLYLLDGDGSLGSFAGSPWVGSCLTPEHLRTAAHLVHRLAETARSGSETLILCITDWGRWVTAFRSGPWHDAEDTISELIRFSPPNLVVAVGGGRELLTATFQAAIPNRIFLTCGSSAEATMLWPRLPGFMPTPGRAAIAGPINAQAGQGDAETMHIAQLGHATPNDPTPNDAVPAPARSRAAGTLHVAPLPSALSMAQMRHVAAGYRPPGVATGAAGQTVVVGVGGDGLQVLDTTLAQGTVLPVVGGPGTGKSSFVRAMALLNGGFIGDFPPGSGEGAGAGRILWLDDAASMNPEALQQATRRLASGAVIVAAFPYPGPALSLLPLEWGLRSPQQGIVLRPQRPSDADLFGVRLDTAGAEPQGRGVLIDRGRLSWFQFPDATVPAAQLSGHDAAGKARRH